MSDLNALKTLVALKECGNLTNTARKLDVPKSTLSRRLAILEAQVGQQLTCQSGRNLTLNPAGRCYMTYAAQALQIMNEGQEALQRLVKAPCGHLRVGLCPEMSRGWSTETLNRFNQVYPEIDLDIQVSNSISSPDHQRCDFYISCNNTPEFPGFQSQCFGRWEQGLYASASLDPNAVTRTLEQQRWICSPKSANSIWLEAQGKPEKVQIRPLERVNISCLHMRSDAIAQGHGVGLLPRWLVECVRYGQPGTQRIMPEHQGDDITLWMHYHHEHDTAAVKAIREWLINHVPSRWRLKTDA
ncbi:MAG: LysR family transcriptional regulator [Alteromonadaceae bacterium]|nr:LysR family transcriptional regulator [Alteromonadaceae bacterium]